MARGVIIALVGCIFLIPQNVFAVSASTNFKIYNGQVDSVSENSTSDSFEVNSGGGLAEKSASDSFTVKSGTVPIPLAAEASSDDSSSSSGGGGGGSLPDKVPTTVENLTIINITDSTAQIVFDTNEIAVAYIQYGVGNLYNLSTATEDSFSENHSFLLKDLVPGVEYNFTIHLKDLPNNVKETKSYSFISLPIVKQVSNVTNFEAVFDGSNIGLSWKNPEINDMKSIKLVRNNKSYPNNSTDGESIYVGEGESYKDSDIIANVTYYYSLFVVDTSGNISSGAIKAVSTGKTTYEEKEKAESITEKKDKSEGDTKKDKVELPYFPAEPQKLPEGLVDITPEESQITIEPTLFSLMKQRINRGLYDVAQIFRDLGEDSRERVSQIKEGLVDQFGAIQANIYKTLTPEEKVEIEEILQEKLPDIASEEEKSIVAPITVQPIDESVDWHVFADSDAIFAISASMFRKPVETITLTLKTEAYVLSYNRDSNQYEATINAPKEKGKYQMIVQIIYTDNTYEELDRTVLVDPYGVVYTKEWGEWSWKKPWKVFTRQESLIKSAEVTLFVLNKTGEWVVWPAHLYNQINPQVTAEDGEFAFKTPPGDYYLQVKSATYRDKTTDSFTVNEEVINKRIALTKIGDILQTIIIICGIILILSIAIYWLFFKEGIKKKK